MLLVRGQRTRLNELPPVYEPGAWVLFMPSAGKYLFLD